MGVLAAILAHTLSEIGKSALLRKHLFKLWLPQVPR